MNEITEADLLRFLYGETSEARTETIRAALKKDSQLRQSLNNLKQVQAALNEARATPSKSVVDRILKYAAKKQSGVQAH